MKRILIIGAKGMLGQELVRVFSIGGDCEVFAWDKEEIDITNRGPAQEKILVLSPKIIINAAAYNAVDRAEEPEEFQKAKVLNGQAVGWLAEIAKKLGATFINYSSDYVFSGEKKEGQKEDDEVSPISNYGISKALGEKEIKQIGGKYYIIRLQKLFGQKGDSPAAKKSFFETMLNSVKTKKELDVVDEELANFTFAPDLAKQTKYLIENNLPYGIYHITNEGRPVTWFGATQILFDLAGIKDIKLNPIGSDKFSRAAARPKYSILINTKLPPLRSWDIVLKGYLAEN